MDELKKAIDLYSDMLPYINTGGNPHDDRRLYKIAYIAYKTKQDIPEEYFKEQLRKNTTAQLDILNDDDFNDFFSTILGKIKDAIYIFDRAQV